jgi:hypothetical protein
MHAYVVEGAEGHDSMTMHILGGLVQAAMKRTTLGWRSATWP